MRVEPWVSALVDLLIILGDGNENRNLTTITKRQMAAMRRNWSTKANKAKTDKLRHRILTLRTLYDWPALTGCHQGLSG